MRLTEYKIENERLTGRTFAVISDLHGCDPSEAILLLEGAKPDYILAPGDIFERLDGSCEKANESGYLLLSAAAKIAPTFYSPGNHEIGGTRSWALGVKIKRPQRAEMRADIKDRIVATGTVILDGGFVIEDGIAFGGLGSGILNEGGVPDLSLLDGFFAEKCPKILLCHHPEYYEKYLADIDLDLVVSGHAHGGQWRFFGRGVFAPGQGIFPKYTSGVHGGRLVISLGLKKGGLIPRIFNPTEIVLVRC